MASWTEWNHRCLGCGGAVDDVLWRLGSKRCHDCRDRGRLANPAILEEWADGQRLLAEEITRRRKGEQAREPQTGPRLGALLRKRTRARSA